MRAGLALAEMGGLKGRGARHRIAVPAGHLDFAVLVGPEMEALARELGKAPHNALGIRIAFAHCETPGDAISALEEYGLGGGDAVLVKGSNSVGLGRVVAHFAAREG